MKNVARNCWFASGFLQGSITGKDKDMVVVKGKVKVIHKVTSVGISNNAGEEMKKAYVIEAVEDNKKRCFSIRSFLASQNRHSK